MKYKLFILVLSILMVIQGCSGGGGGGSNSGGGGSNGTSSPNLKSVSISPNSANAGSTVTINFNFAFSDPEGDLGGGSAYYNDGTNITSFALPNSLTGVKDGTGSGQLSLKIGPNPGTYNVSCWLVDKAGNKSNTIQIPFNVIGSPAYDYLLTCESEGFEYKRCNARSRIINAFLVTKLSATDCIFNDSWGFNAGSGFFGSYIWVDKGCRGHFGIDE